MKAFIGTLTFVFAMSLGAVSCGTVAGNPIKPGTGSSGDAPKAVVYTLPSVGFDLADESLQLADNSLQLLPFVSDSADKTLFNALGRRFNGLVREVDATATRINALLAQQAKLAADRKTLHVKHGGKAGKIAAHVGPSDTPGFDHSAVLCADGRPLQLMRWSDLGGSIELWRDFSIDQGDDETHYGVVSRLRVTKTAAGVLALDLTSSGSWSDSADEDAANGAGLAERVRVERDSSTGIVTLRSTTQHYSGATPAAFSADTFISSRLSPRSDGGKGYDVAFVGYSTSSKRSKCQSGFSDSAADLWHPIQDKPRFCLGRAPAGAKLKNFDEFAALVASFESVGIVKQAELERISMPTGLSCDQ